MRYFANTKEVDGYTVVIGFRAPPIDPVATSRVVDTVIEETTEYKAARELSEKWSQLEQNRKGFILAARKTVAAKDLASIQRSYLDTVDRQKETQKQLATHAPALKAKRKDLYQKNAVYFIPPGYEEISDKVFFENLQRLFSELKGNQFLTIHGDTITDHRGEHYWLKDEVCGWAEITVKGLSEEIPTGSIRSDKLSKENIAEIHSQKELERISNLSEEQRKTEKEAKLSRALSISTVKRSEYEIYGADNPLELAQKWYQDEVSKIETLYKLN